MVNHATTVIKLVVADQIYYYEYMDRKHFHHLVQKKNSRVLSGDALKKTLCCRQSSDFIAIRTGSHWLIEVEAT